MSSIVVLAREARRTMWMELRRQVSMTKSLGCRRKGGYAESSRRAARGRRRRALLPRKIRCMKRHAAAHRDLLRGLLRWIVLLLLEIAMGKCWPMGAYCICGPGRPAAGAHLKHAAE